MSNLIEALSWRIATEVCRRDPAITIRETHPCGGHYDCLSLLHPKRGHLADLNRLGSIHIMSRVDGRPADNRPPLWEDALAIGTVAMVDRVSAALGQAVPRPLPPSTARILTYRAIAACLGAVAFGRESWECRSGWCDTSGDGGGLGKWFKVFPEALARLDHTSNEALWSTAATFWFLLREDRPLACLSEDGIVWLEGGDAFTLLPLYAETRKLRPIMQRIIGDRLE